MTEKATYRELKEKIEKLEKQLSEKEALSKQLEINQRRLKSLWKIASIQDSGFKEICDTVLEEIVAMTESRYGFYGFMDKSEKEFALYSWSESVMKDCAVHAQPKQYLIEESGLWGNAVRKRKPVLYNNYASELENKKGLPGGHVKITRILSVPIFSIEGEILALGCVANKEEDYTDEDAVQLTTYLGSAQLILENRKKEEERKALVQKALSELKILRGILPLCSFCKKIRDDKGYWEQVDVYLHKYSQADISHSICPECMKEHYPKEYKKIYEKE